MQDLSGFSVPKGFRGGTLLKCNYGGQYRQQYLPGRPSIVSLAGIFITFIRRKNRKNVVIRPSVKITYPWKLTLGDTRGSAMTSIYIPSVK